MAVVLIRSLKMEEKPCQLGWTHLESKFINVLEVFDRKKRWTKYE
jgi:hypothetical protein